MMDRGGQIRLEHPEIFVALGLGFSGDFGWRKVLMSAFDPLRTVNQMRRVCLTTVHHQISGFLEQPC
jgi:hypothetical protein